MSDGHFFTIAEENERRARIHDALAWMAGEFGHAERDAFLRAHGDTGGGPMLLQAVVSAGYVTERRGQLEMTPLGYVRERAHAPPPVYMPEGMDA